MSVNGRLSEIVEPPRGLRFDDGFWPAEALIPLNREGGSGVGARIQLLLFTDDIVPSLFGKPLLSQERVVSTVDKYPGH